MKSASTMREEIFQYAKEKFGTKPEYIWLKFPKLTSKISMYSSPATPSWFFLTCNNAAYHFEFSLFLKIVKCDPILIGSLPNNNGYLPRYHMNKANWITLLLDGSVPKDDVFNFIDLSY